MRSPGLVPEIWFLFGIDAPSGDLTDFGGGVKEGETDVEAALRELSEESRGALSFVTEERIASSLGVTTTTETRKGSTTVFVEVEPSVMALATVKFYEQEGKDKELSGLHWKKGSELLNMIRFPGRLWSRLRTTYRPVDEDFLQSLVRASNESHGLHRYVAMS